MRKKLESLRVHDAVFFWFFLQNSVGHNDSFNSNPAAYWESAFNKFNMTIPNAVRNLMSPLSEIETRIFEHHLTSNKLKGDEQALASALCTLGGLFCSNLDEYDEVPIALMRAVFTDCISADCFSSLAQNIARDQEMISNAKLLWFKEKDLLHGVGTNNAYQTLGSILVSSKTQLFQRSFLPRSLSILLGAISEGNLPNLLKLFHIRMDSIMATGMHSTVKIVQHGIHSLLPGEARTIITSIEDIADLLSNLLSKSNSKLTSFETLPTSTSFPKEDEDMYKGLFKVVKADMKSDVNSQYLSCHSPIFPCRLEICHYVPETRIYQVTLESIAIKMKTIQTVAICHTDTSHWDPNHVSFQVLDAYPGGDTLCHWVESDGFTFVGKIKS